MVSALPKSKLTAPCSGPVAALPMTPARSHLWLSPAPRYVEVHQGVAGVGPLWYRTGGLPVGWRRTDLPVPFSYDNGEAPRVAVAGPTILEVHQAGTGVGPLWYPYGRLLKNGCGGIRILRSRPLHHRGRAVTASSCRTLAHATSSGP